MSQPIDETGAVITGTRVFGWTELMAVSGVVVVAVAFFLSFDLAASLFWTGGAALFFSLLEPLTSIVISVKSAGVGKRKA